MPLELVISYRVHTSISPRTFRFSTDFPTMTSSLKIRQLHTNLVFNYRLFFGKFPHTCFEYVFGMSKLEWRFRRKANARAVLIVSSCEGHLVVVIMLPLSIYMSLSSWPFELNPLKDI